MWLHPPNHLRSEKDSQTLCGISISKYKGNIQSSVLSLSSPFQNIRCSLFASHSEDHLTWCMQDCALLSFLRSSGEYITVLQHIPVCGMQIVVFCTIYGYVILYMYLIPYILYGERTNLLPKHLIIGICHCLCVFFLFPLLSVRLGRRQVQFINQNGIAQGNAPSVFRF